MHDRAWEGVIVAGVFFAGLFTGHWYPGAGTKTTATTHEAAKMEQVARSEEQRTAEATAADNDTAVEHDRTETRKPDGTITVATAERSFHWRHVATAEEHEQKQTEVRTVVQVVHDTKTVTEVRQARPDWSLAVLGGIDAGVTPLVAAQVGRRILGPFEAIVQVQAAPSALSRWAVFAGVGARW